MRFEIRRDAWIKLVLYITSFCMVPIIFTVPKDEMFIAAITVILYMAFILPFLWSGYYELREDYLYIRIGYIFTKVKYHKIIDIQESNGLTNSFSMTSDRVTIQTGKSKIFNVIHVGPEDKERFMYELSVRCPNLKPKEY